MNQNTNQSVDLVIPEQNIETEHTKIRLQGLESSISTFTASVANFSQSEMRSAPAGPLLIWTKVSPEGSDSLAVALLCAFLVV